MKGSSVKSTIELVRPTDHQLVPGLQFTPLQLTPDYFNAQTDIHDL